MIKPFLSGVVGGTGVFTGFLIAMHSAYALGDQDWGFFVLQILWAALFVACGFLFLLTVMELR